MSDVRAAGGPHGRVRDALHELERQYPPRVAEPGDVEETKHVARQTQTQHLEMNIEIMNIEYI